jgi:D-beta-D-heptose 7-phosphate kinase/D-beta-D-heptose 1-phosphate adenosyltransferase
MTKIVIATGGFDPIHSGHIEYLNAAKQLGDLLVVGLNSDEWLKRKKGKPFMPWSERQKILQNIRCVDLVAEFDDSDNTAIDCIRKIHRLFPNAKIIFANGGDRTIENIPEMGLALKNLSFVFSVGGSDKKNSSSWILNEWEKKHIPNE